MKKRFILLLVTCLVFPLSIVNADCEVGATIPGMDCNQFFICIGNGFYVEQSCPIPMLYNSVTNMCEPPDSAPCSSNGSATISLINPPNSSKTWRFGGTQSITVYATNQNILGVTFTMHNVFNNLLMGGFLMPGVTWVKNDSNLVNFRCLTDMI